VTVLSIRLYGDPVLRAHAQPIAQWSAELDRLVGDMVETMRAANGVGLAAPQVGRSIQLFVAQPPSDEGEAPLVVLANPVIVAEEGSESASEGCLSIPEVEEEVERATRVRVRGFSPEGTPVEIEATGYLARIMQHEIDHLNGILFIDKISPLKRRLLKKRLDEIKREGEEARGAAS
jgi:peptide deformylase